MICVDASVAVKWLLNEPFTANADALLEHVLAQREPMIAPVLLPSEVANTLLQRRRRGELAFEDARARLDRFLGLQIEFLAPEGLHGLSLVLSEEYGLPAVYDAYYVALAQRCSAALWTADGKLIRAVAWRLPFVHWIGDYPVQS